MYKLKITNLPKWISEIHLKQFFYNCGSILHAKVALDKNTLRPLGYGYIEFANEDSMKKALNKNASILDGAVIRVELDDQVEQISSKIIDSIDV